MILNNFIVWPPISRNLIDTDFFRFSPKQIFKRWYNNKKIIGANTDPVKINTECAQGRITA